MLGPLRRHWLHRITPGETLLNHSSNAPQHRARTPTVVAEEQKNRQRVDDRRDSATHADPLADENREFSEATKFLAFT